MFKQFFAAAVGAAMLAATPAALAQDFSEGSEARSWNLANESLARFEARVVDVLCELSGDCADNCGDGRRVLALVRTADDALIMVNKNSQPIFTGAISDLLPFCNQTVEVDGLMVADPGSGGQFYQIQRVRVGDGEWGRTRGFLDDWNARFPEVAEGEGQWFRRDPRITSRIAQNGYLGLGLDVDAAFIEEEFGQ